MKAPPTFPLDLSAKFRGFVVGGVPCFLGDFAAEHLVPGTLVKL